MPVAVAIMAVLCAVSLFVMLRLAGSSRYGVRCLTFAFTAAAALCALAATIIFPAIHMEALSINPASVKQLIVTYVQNLFGRFGLFASSTAQSRDPSGPDRHCQKPHETPSEHLTGGPTHGKRRLRND